MKASLFILMLFLFICQGLAQTSDGTDNTTSCDAAFSSNPDPLNPMIIYFEDNSSGQITLWQWNFGDGSTSTEQNPVHTYAAGGHYFICLTVSNNDSGFVCHDVLCISLTIHEPGTCIADYQYTFDPVDQLKTDFTDLSSGNINGWHWDFGDGAYSYDRNPIHTFPSFGKFRVCLTAYNIDSVSVCNDIKCDTVELKPPPECHALFTSELDTLNQLPNTFKFYSVSSGDPNKYRWKFDDGASYDTQHVIHHFQSFGTHEVCLVVKKEVHGEIVCIDSICRNIVSPKYVNLGGHLFTGAFPINNPVSTGDTGVAYLYRVDGSRLLPYDTSKFTQMGYYAFPAILNGSYIIKAALTTGSTHYSKYFPAYYPLAMKWKEADILDLSNSNSYVSDIHLSPADDTLTGSGAIRGTVRKAFSKTNFDEVPFAEVLLFNAQLKPVMFTYSGKSGQYEMNNLPYGAYHLYVEYPGKYSRVTAVWLDSSTPFIDSLDLEIFNHDVTSAPEVCGKKVMAGDLFPNPATGSVNLIIELANATPLKFEIRTLTGLTVWSGSISCQSGSNLVTVPLHMIRAGLYLLVIGEIDGTLVAVKKLLRY